MSYYFKIVENLSPEIWDPSMISLRAEFYKISSRTVCNPVFEFSVNTFPFYAMTKLQTAIILAPRKKITGSKIIVTTASIISLQVLHHLTSPSRRILNSAKCENYQSQCCCNVMLAEKQKRSKLSYYPPIKPDLYHIHPAWYREVTCLLRWSRISLA